MNKIFRYDHTYNRHELLNITLVLQTLLCRKLVLKHNAKGLLGLHRTNQASNISF